MYGCTQKTILPWKSAPKNGPFNPPRNCNWATHRPPSPPTKSLPNFLSKTLLKKIGGRKKEATALFSQIKKPPLHLPRLPPQCSWPQRKMGRFPIFGPKLSFPSFRSRFQESKSFFPPPGHMKTGLLFWFFIPPTFTRVQLHQSKFFFLFFFSWGGGTRRHG